MGVFFVVFPTLWGLLRGIHNFVSCQLSVVSCQLSVVSCQLSVDGWWGALWASRRDARRSSGVEPALRRHPWSGCGDGPTPAGSQSVGLRAEGTRDVRPRGGRGDVEARFPGVSERSAPQPLATLCDPCRGRRKQGAIVSSHFMGVCCAEFIIWSVVSGPWSVAGGSGVVRRVGLWIAGLFRQAGACPTRRGGVARNS